ncbi:MAG: four helix bundle protein [Candidatus Omnitrophota bacterium]
MDEKKRIVSFKDLEVYQKSYDACITVMTMVLPKLPDAEKYDLKDQLSRSSKAIPRLIAEGYAKRHQRFGFQKYLDDAIAECNETVVSLSQCIDIYPTYIEKNLCEDLVGIYDIIARQLYRLTESWNRLKMTHQLSSPIKVQR